VGRPLKPLAPMKAVFLLLLLTSTLAEASIEASCSPVDLRAQVGAVRDQGNSDWCASFVGADLISAKLGYRVSATSVGINYYYSKRSAFEEKFLNQMMQIPAGEFGGALMTTVLQTNLPSENCNEADLPDSDVVQNKKQVYEAIVSNRASTKSYLICQTPVALTTTSHEIAGDMEKAVVSLDVLQNQLSQNNIVAALIDSSALFTGVPNENPMIQMYGNHYVSVIGRRLHEGRCELFVRNSWGSDCSSRTYSNTQIQDCDAGHFWVNESEFAND
jgi:hypothetical protein